MNTEAALLWLASQERQCPNCTGCLRGYELNARGACSLCAGTGMVPLLGLRTLCPWCQGNGEQCLNLPQTPSDPHCAGRGWIPKQGRDALHNAMQEMGWEYCVFSRTKLDAERTVRFYGYNRIKHCLELAGKDSDDWLAAVKALKAAG